MNPLHGCLMDRPGEMIVDEVSVLPVALLQIGPGVHSSSQRERLVLLYQLNFYVIRIDARINIEPVMKMIIRGIQC